MDYGKISKEIVGLVGGEKNIESAAHCATRLRLVLNDESLVNVKEIEKIEEVKGTFKSAGQFQIIIGQGTVNKLYEEMMKTTKIERVSVSDAKKKAMKNMNLFQRFARVLSNIFVPIIPAIVASGLLMGLLSMAIKFQWVNDSSGVITLLDMFSNVAFVFMPILIAFSAAEEFGANPFLAAALGGILIHPNLQNAWTLGGGIEQYIDIFGYSVGMIGYQGTVLPVLIAVWVMSYIEKGVRKIVPDILDIILTPFITLITTAIISLLVIGPFGRFIGDGISIGLQFLYNTAGPLAGVIFGGLYSLIVITGIHHSFHAIEAGLLSNPDIGVNFLLPIWAMANVAQGGAAFAAYFKTNNKKIKVIAIPAATSCMLGITEAAIFGVNLRLIKPFIAAAIGGAVAGGYVVLTKVVMTSVGVTGIPGIAIVQLGSLLNYIIGMIIAFGVSFALTWILGFKENDEEEKTLGIESVEKINNKLEIDSIQKLDSIQEIDDIQKLNDATKIEECIISPLSGEVICLSEVPDRTFSEKIMGDGVAILPSEGTVTSPIDGEITLAFETKHVIGMVSENGTEILIHVGIDTVKMNGEGFKSFIKTGDKVKKGDKLIEVDLELVKSLGFSTITPVIITNTNEVISIDIVDDKKVNNSEKLMIVVK
ncbi:sucrose-specific PTS transporter subunit IIBC [Clostridium sp. DL1XJH146]